MDGWGGRGGDDELKRADAQGEGNSLGRVTGQCRVQHRAGVG